MTFKEQLAADVGAVFLNPQEFGEVHRVNDEEMVIVIDGYASSEHPSQAGQYLDGIYTKQRRVYVAAVDFGPLPAQESFLTIDDEGYTVMDAIAEGDVYMITIGGEQQPMIDIRYELDKKQFRSVDRDLSKLRSNMPKVLKRTADKTATSARVLLVKGMQETYTIKSTGAKKDMVIRKASDQAPTATIKISGESQPSIRFRHSKGGRDGVKLQVRTDDPFQAIKPIKGRKAFIAQMASGHKGIFQRKAGEFMKKSPRLSDSRTKLKTQHTEKIKEHTSISPASMAANVFRGHGGVSEGMGPDIEGLYKKYFGQQIELVLKKRKKGGT